MGQASHASRSSTSPLRWPSFEAARQHEHAHGPAPAAPGGCSAGFREARQPSRNVVATRRGAARDGEGGVAVELEAEAGRRAGDGRAGHVGADFAAVRPGVSEPGGGEARALGDGRVAEGVREEDRRGGGVRGRGGDRGRRLGQRGRAAGGAPRGDHQQIHHAEEHLDAVDGRGRPRLRASGVAHRRQRSDARGLRQAALGVLRLRQGGPLPRRQRAVRAHGAPRGGPLRERRLGDPRGPGRRGTRG